MNAAQTTITREQFRQSRDVFFQGGDIDRHEIVMVAAVGDGFQIHASSEKLRSWRMKGRVSNDELWTTEAALFECDTVQEMLDIASGILPLAQYRHLLVEPILETE